ncbi:MAG: YraN family protein [Marinilabiliales bacterium]|nr:MAG: YraN family protein [Marinilabiliales bacterium]
MNAGELGKYGEELAVNYLSRKGYEILDRNWRHKQDEIDIVTRIGMWLVFVEVKTRSGNAYGKPYESVDNRKEKAMIRAAEAYIEEKELDENIRFDIISVLVSGEDDVLIEHIEFAISL